MNRALTAAAAAVILLTGCGAAASHPAQHAITTANTRVCEHYRTQRAFVRHDTAPTLADTVKVLGWIAADVGQVTPGTPLARDLGRMLRAMQGHGSTYAASRQVFADCAALGVQLSQ